MLVILVNIFDAVFSQSYRKHQVKYDLIEKLSHITFLSTVFLAQTSRVKHRTIERFKIEKDLRIFIDKYVRDSIFWDVGACVGNFSVYAASIGSTVYCFEPDGLTFSTLVHNTANSKLDIFALPIALGKANAIESLNMRVFESANAYNTVGRNVSFDGSNFKPAAKIACMQFRGDYLVTGLGLPIPNYIKIDVDGNELQVLEGLGLLLRHPELRGIAIELIKDNPETQLSEELINDNGFIEVFFGSNVINSLETNRFFLRAEIVLASKSTNVKF
jgi:FkbM family methyltransferase